MKNFCFHEIHFKSCLFCISSFCKLSLNPFTFPLCSINLTVLLFLQSSIFVSWRCNKFIIDIYILLQLLKFGKLNLCLRTNGFFSFNSNIDVIFSLLLLTYSNSILFFSIFTLLNKRSFVFILVLSFLSIMKKIEDDSGVNNVTFFF